MKLLILAGKHSNGKTSTLKILTKKFKNADIYALDGKGNIIGYALKQVPKRGDFIAKIYFEGMIIGIVSKGDKDTLIGPSFNSLFSILSKDEKFDCIVCAIRNYEKQTFDIIEVIISVIKKFTQKIKYISNYVNIIQKTVGNHNVGSM